jgi:hypothetical protein
MIVLLALELHSLPSVLTDIDTRAADVFAVRHKMSCKPQSEVLRRLDVVCLPREGVDGVLHRVGRQAQAVVAGCVDGREIALERDVQCEALDLVSGGALIDL